MTLEEYKQGIKDLEILHENNVKLLLHHYLDTVNKYKKGDIIESIHGEKMQIEKMRYCKTYYGSNNPTIEYVGIKINKNGSLSKRNEVVYIPLKDIK